MINQEKLSYWQILPDATKLNIFNETGRKIGLPAMAVEKDWWVVHVLAMIFSVKCAPYLLFKGGTSLSKGWGLIDRFSEDIDLAVHRALFGFGEDLNKQQIKKLRKESYKYLITEFLDDFVSVLKHYNFNAVQIKK